MNNPAQLKVVGGWVLLVLIGFISMAWLQPRMVNEARAELDGLQLRLARAEDGAAEIRALVDELSGIQDSTQSIKQVPRDSQFARLMQDLAGRLTALGIEDHEITTGGSVNLGPADSIPMKISMTSGFPGVYETIVWVESLPRLIRVQRLLIETKDKDNPWESDIKVEITLDAVFDPTAPLSNLASVDPEASR